MMLFRCALVGACCWIATSSWAENRTGRVTDGILYGTQYYRAPTPLPSEWEKDMVDMSAYGLNVIQLRLNWRQNERVEDVYDFSDIDGLMDLAEKHGKKVIVKFLLECAPQYVFERYGGTRIGPKGERIRGGSHGAFYTGGWLPCFTNPKVAERAARFVEKVVERYAKRANLILWNAWNEPRCKPVEECFCNSCHKAFGEHLRKRFGTIERLNAYYGVAEESFETIALPAMPHGYWDIFEFKRFKSGTCIRNNLRFVYEAVRRHDKVRPVVSHVGCTSGFQTRLGDICDDFEVSKAVDGWGTSLPLDTRMETAGQRLAYGRLNDFMRCVNPNYLVYEIYPGLGMFDMPYDTNWDMDYKLFLALACGAKGMLFWQYRSERVGMENDCAGLARMNGAPRPVLASVKEFGDLLDGLGPDVADFYPNPAEVAIVFDYKSLLMSEIEDACGLNYAFERPEGGQRFYYPYAHVGFYELMRRHDIPVDYLNIADLKSLSRYKVAYFPHCSMLDPACVPEIESFVSNGGVLIADEGFGMRQQNTWMNPDGVACGKVLHAELTERRAGTRKLVMNDFILDTSGYHSEYEVDDAKTLLRFADGKSAAQVRSLGTGRACLLGFSLGYSAHESHVGEWFRIFEELTCNVSLRHAAYGRFSDGIEERRLYRGNEQLLFLINSSGAVKTVGISERVKKTYGRGGIKDGCAVIPPRSGLILSCER